eukprot:c39278_g1_i1 orf=32-235(+)
MLLWHPHGLHWHPTVEANSVYTYGQAHLNICICETPCIDFASHLAPMPGVIVLPQYIILSVNFAGHY